VWGTERGVWRKKIIPYVRNVKKAGSDLGSKGRMAVKVSVVSEKNPG